MAQDSTRYGLDLGVRDGLAYLLRRLGRIDGLRWIRVMYAYPATLTDPILDAIASEEKVVKYVDIPLQHASESGAQAHEAAHRQGQPPGHGGAHPRPGARGGRPDLVHRRLPRRDRGGLRGAARVRGGRARSTTSASSPSPTRRARRPSTSRAGCAAGVKKSRRRPPDGPAEADLGPQAQPGPGGGAGGGPGRGAPRRHRPPARGRTAAQAPEIDGRVILNDGTAARGQLRDLRDHRSPRLRPRGPHRGLRRPPRGLPIELVLLVRLLFQLRELHQSGFAPLFFLEL